MLLNEKGAVAALKEAFKEGYIIAPGVEMMSIYTSKWAIVAPVRLLPLAVSQMLVEHARHIPDHAAKVRKDRDEQMVMEEDVAFRADRVIEIRQRSVMMHKMPVIFKDRWQLYRMDNGKVFAFDTELLNIVDGKNMFDTYVTPDGLGLWSVGAQMVTIAPAQFSPSDTRAVEAIAKALQERVIEEGEEVENVCLFDDLEGDEDA